LVEHSRLCTTWAFQIINSPSDVWCASRVSVGSLLFILYTADLMSLIEDNGFSPHLYADDTPVYGSCRPVEIDAFSAKLSECIGVVTNWMRSNRLQLNSDKTEVLWCTTGRRQHQLQPLHCRSTASRSLWLHPPGTWASSSILI